MSNKTVKELKSTAKELGLKGYSKLRKFELIKMIEDYKHNESANKLRSFAKEFGARHRDFIKQIDRTRNSSNILDEAVPEINVPILKPKRLESLEKLAGRIAKPVRKNINQFADWILFYVSQLMECCKPEIKESESQDKFYF